MLVRNMGASLLVLLLPFLVAAQETKTVEDLDKEIEGLRVQVQASIDSIGKLQADVLANTDAVNANKANIDDMLQNQADMMKRLDDVVIMLQERHETLKAITDVREEGEVIISNRMATEQRILVNQQPYDVRAGDTVTVTVPTGTLTAQLPNQPFTNWTIAAPKYQQKIDIVPTNQRVTVNRQTLTDIVPLDGVPLDGSNTTVRALRPLSSSYYVAPTQSYYAPSYYAPSYYDSTPFYMWSY